MRPIRRKTLRFLIKTNPFVSFGNVLTSATEPLTLEYLRLGRDVLRTFTTSARIHQERCPVLRSQRQPTRLGICALQRLRTHRQRPP